jgi:Bacteriophage baseplate protein W
MAADDLFLGQGLAFPLHVGPDGHLALSRGEDNVRQSIRLILATEPRERVMLPAFGAGLGRFLFEPNLPPTHRLIEERIRQSLGRFEPRIEVESVVVLESPLDPREAIATLRYRVVATGLADRLDLTLRLAA